MKITHRAAAETIGTFILVFAGCGSLMVADRFPNSIALTSVPVVFGLVVAAMIYALGHISGAHMNPAVTLAFAVTRHFPKREVLIYWIAQIIGACLAILLLKLTLPAGALYGATLPSIPPVYATIWEIVITFILMFVVMATATDTRAQGMMAGAAIGATVTFCAMIAGPMTGASMNPARSLAPAIFQGTLDSLYIYMVGPFVGAVAAALLYKVIRGTKTA